MYKLQIDYNPGKKNVDKFYVQDLPQCHYWKFSLLQQLLKLLGSIYIKILFMLLNNCFV